MSWINFQNLIDNLDVNPEHWQTAIEANPNTPEDALKVAVMKIFETKDMQSLDDLCSCVVSIVRQAVEHSVQPTVLNVRDAEVACPECGCEFDVPLSTRTAANA